MMKPDGITWIVVADAVQARFLEERQRSGGLRELSDNRMAAESHDRPQTHRHTSTVHESGGPGRHGAGERDIGEEAARRFLQRVAQRLEDAVNDGKFDELALIAEPRTLGLLKAELGPRAEARLSATNPHDCVREDPERLRRRLQQARARQ